MDIEDNYNSEHRFYNLKSLQPVSYGEDSGIKNILRGLTRFGWQEVMEHDFLIQMYVVESRSFNSLYSFCLEIILMIDC